MSKTSEKYIISRLESTERDLKWTERTRQSLIEDLKKTNEKLSVLVHLFEQTTSENGEYVWYRLKGSSLISPEADAYKIIKAYLEVEEEEGIPF